MSAVPDLAAWLRRQVEADLAAARIINAGGFSPQRWDTEPPGQVNPEDIPQSDAVTAALGCPPEYICGWVQVVAYDKLNNEPDEAYGRDSGAPVALVDDGRREFEHIIRHDPRNVVARCEAELAILAMHSPTRPHPEFGFTYPAAAKFCGFCGPGDNWQAEQEPDHYPFALWPCQHVRLLGSGYRHRPGYLEEWAP